MAMNLFAIINTWTIIFRDLLSYNSAYVYGWCFVQILINAYFLVELVVDLFTAGSLPVAFGTKFRLWPESICQLLNMYAIGFLCIYFIYTESLLKTLKYFEAIIFIR